MEKFLSCSAEVADALAAGRAVVALESTIIAHGMPYPKNVETALLVEQTVRAEGAVPATCAIIGGKLKSGLTTDEIEWLGKNGSKIPKASRRDLPYLLSKGAHGATTVAGTMIIAHLAGMCVFATGGIGGVHRGAETTMDISADLPELARTPVAVVSAGAKSILDLGLTLEFLETQGVPVVGYQTDAFPAFYTRTSAFRVDYRMDTLQEIAAFLHTKWALEDAGGVLIANPIPEAFAMDPEAIEAAIQQALSEANENGVKGKALTPFLLARIEAITLGDSLRANVELVVNNARVGAGITVEWAAQG
jgi:pseudouridine-5'-phosphate glycosidase